MTWELVNAILGVGALVRFLEPYDPQHMPVEVGFRAMKDFLRNNRLLLDHLTMAGRIEVAADSVTAAAARNAFRTCGYCL